MKTKKLYKVMIRVMVKVVSVITYRRHDAALDLLITSCLGVPEREQISMLGALNVTCHEDDYYA